MMADVQLFGARRGDPAPTAPVDRNPGLDGAATPRRPAADIVIEARATFPTFTEGLWAVCR